MSGDDGGAWYFVTESNIIKNWERMPIPHKIHPQERRRIVRNSSRKSTAKTRGTTGNGLDNYHLTDEEIASRQRLESIYDFNYEPPDSDNEAEEKPGDKKDVSKHVYLAACKQCNAAPATSIIQGLNTNKLCVKGLRLTSKEIQPIAYALTMNSSVTTLDVSSNDMGKDGLYSILRMLDENTSITCLNISHNNIGSEGANLISELITKNKHLRVLEAAGNKFGDEEAENLSTALEETQTLEQLNLSHNNFREKGGEILAEGIEGNTSIVALDLSWNNLRLGGATAIAEALKVNETVQTLNIAWNGFSNDGAKSFSSSLENNNTLVKLDLSNNRIGYDGAHCLAQALKVNETLQHLMLNMNSLSTLGATELLVSIRDNPKCAIHKLELEEVPVLQSALALEEEIKQERPKFELIHDVIVLSDDPLALASAYKKKKTTEKES